MGISNKFEVSYSLSDQEFFRSRGMSLKEVSRQRALLTADKPFRIRAERACTPGDGVLLIKGEQREEFIVKGRDAVVAGRLTDFVPASGAATRMFADLLEARNSGDSLLCGVPEAASNDKKAQAVLKIFDALGDYAFYEELREAVLDKSLGRLDLKQYGGAELLRNGYGSLIISTLVDAESMGLANRPKALIPFHRYNSQDIRTALSEHLHTAVAVGSDKDSTCRVHFTCSTEHMDCFQLQAKKIAEQLRRELGVKFQITFSIQHPSTDMVCVDQNGDLGRDAQGNPMLRPGGHGALLFNLDQLAKDGADVVYINNIDNVHPERFRAEFVDSKLLLLGVLTEVQMIAHEAINALRRGLSMEGIDNLYREVSKQIGLGIPDEQWHNTESESRAALLAEALNRPVRVVGVVKNTGEPGGGPMWVKGVDGRVTKQLVERHELDPADAGQQNIFTSGTHFNPVRIMCGLRDSDGNPYDLFAFVNDQAVLISDKSTNGSKVRIIERPGLWNGSMAEWITVFVDVDASTFAPVKSVVDLARPAHQC